MTKRRPARTLRDDYAMAALQGMLAGLAGLAMQPRTGNSILISESVYRVAFEAADRMMEERLRRSTGKKETT